ncbi:MAG: TIGR03936 family radical SAM-associated protein [Chloroflexota bacterium]|nr:TIGR03936 family radical SAM-associated protein [Chloroflexota bacterium]
MSQSDAVQRLQIRFAAEGPLKYVSHLDLMRVWERVCKRAGLPLASSRGFSPRPKIALAAPLAVGATSEAEILDLLLTERVDLQSTMRALSDELTAGLRIIEIGEGPLKQESLQSMLRAACYEVEVSDRRSPDEWRLAIDELLARDEIPWSQRRGKETKSYDLRPLILEIDLLDVQDGIARLAMRLRNDERGAGRPEQVTLALGAVEEPTRIHRTAIELASEPVTA